MVSLLLNVQSDKNFSVKVLKFRKPKVWRLISLTILLVASYFYQKFML